MNREKQKEKVKIISDICPFYKEYGTCERCNTELDIDDPPCYFECMADHIIRCDYRKQSEVVGEIVDEILRYLRLNEDISKKCKEENGEKNEEYWRGKLAAFKQIRGFIDVEIKKKHTDGEGGANGGS